MTNKEMIDRFGTIYRDEMTIEDEREFVEACYEEYRHEKKAETFWSIGSDFPELIGKSFTIVSEIPTDDPYYDLETLPMWVIKFEDGRELSAYADEIFEKDQKEQGRHE